VNRITSDVNRKVLEKVLRFLALGFLGLLQMKQGLLTRTSELKLSCHYELVETIRSRRDSWVGEIDGVDGALAMASSATRRGRRQEETR
jgi:hypothetical protein